MTIMIHDIDDFNGNNARTLNIGIIGIKTVCLLCGIWYNRALSYKG